MSLQFKASMSLEGFNYSASLEADAEILVLFGPSGAGKSMTLQLVAGLVKPEAGSISLDGRTVFDSVSRVNLSPQEREVGYVVQNLALFPHMDVESNVVFGMEGTREEKRRQAESLLGQFGMDGFAHRMPGTLSGGQAQRVALARALGRGARLLLLDEPFSALDDTLRREMRNELMRLRDDMGLTVLFVTHDLREAHLLADRIAVFDAGRVLQSGSRDDVFRRPVSGRVANLVGVTNVIPATVIDSDPNAIRVDALGRTFTCGSWEGELTGYRKDAPVELAIRSERVNLRRGLSQSDENVVEARITADFPFGSNHVLDMVEPRSGRHIEVEIASRPYEVLDVPSTQEWLIELPRADLHVMPASVAQSAG